MVNGRLRARKGARIASIVSGGTIPDSFDYDVILEPTGTFIGTVNEDFAVESMRGDIFLLCTDGLTDGLYDSGILDILRPAVARSPETNPARLLVDAAVAASGRDNSTALVIEIA